MKKLIYAIAIIAIQHSVAQTPFSTPDNIGSGNCLNFDGNNDYVSVPNHPTVDFVGNQPFSVEAWVNTPVATRLRTIVAKWDSQLGEAGQSYHLSMLSTGQPYFQLNRTDGGNPVAIATSSIDDGTWHHVTGVFDGANVMVYVDGTLETTAPIGGTHAAATANLEFGITDRQQATGNYWAGEIDEVRLWSVARSQTQIRENMCLQLGGNETGLVGYWNMNEGTGNTVTDITTNNNDGTRMQ